MSNSASANIFYGIPFNREELEETEEGESVLELLEGDEFKNVQGIEVCWTGYHDYCHYQIIIEKTKISTDWSTKVFDPEKLIIEADWNDKLASFCAKNGILYKQPRWLLAPYYG